ncbi:MAG: DUF882 domain-containing protein [Desulfobacterium sp.]|nr:DUF882 domain-containing protein [Desulfobacterium sp.]MBU3946594.1 DUF882 domain-containing protein [Pseudomonadota bacterium]MBU4010765.1 DUF882 domain-containing protein [Pseudomonadota bacterium]MBU4037351.1 DUF882 domain-containing protein [Pseudomonadota bacterium]
MPERKCTIQPSNTKDQNNGLKLTRRGLLKLIPVAAFSCCFPRIAFGALPDEVSEKRALSFYNIHTQESLSADYWIDGKYMPDALSKINYILRDHRTDEIQPIDTQLLDLLHELGTQITPTQPFHIISGYRSQETNARLHKQGRGVARHSYHVLGQAIDIKIPGCCLSEVRDVAMKLEMGGVGFYPRSEFVHVDTGPVRHW